MSFIQDKFKCFFCEKPAKYICEHRTSDNEHDFFCMGMMCDDHVRFIEDKSYCYRPVKKHVCMKCHRTFEFFADIEVSNGVHGGCGGEIKPEEAKQ